MNKLETLRKQSRLLHVGTQTDRSNQRIHVDMYRPTIYAKSKFQVMSDIPPVVA